MFYITNTEKDTWEVRKMGSRDIRPFAQIIRWGNAWEVRDEMPDHALILRPEFRSVIWDFIEAETRRRGEAQRPVYLYRPEPRQQQKEEMPAWML